MKEGWEYIALSSVCKVQNGFALNSKLFNESNNGLPLIRIRDIKRGYSLTYTDETCSDEFFVEDGDRLQENFDKISQECDAMKQSILRQVFE